MILMIQLLMITMTIYRSDILFELTDHQLQQWPEAADRFHLLGFTERRVVNAGGMEIAIQHNPARIVSTGAKTDKDSIKARKCFLCSENRPDVQLSAELWSGWELLVNPFPIFPLHFTIASRRHTPQTELPLDMASMAESMPDMAVFFNGAKAGASAPDHLHCQAVLKSELPLIRIAEMNHSSSQGNILLSHEMGIDSPFQFISAIITPDMEGMRTLNLIPELTGAPSEDSSLDPDLRNVFFWIDTEGLLRVLVVPRKAHRPTCYFEEGEKKVTISPGAIDMAGVIIAPVEKDFRNLSAGDVARIYSETAFAGTLPRKLISLINNFRHH